MGMTEAAASCVTLCKAETLGPAVGSGKWWL